MDCGREKLEGGADFMSDLAWRDWRPIAVRASPEGLRVDWANFCGLRFIDSFYSQTVGHALNNPARMIFRRETPIEFMDVLAREAPGIAPSGFIFHLSRCGSTLVSRMLAALSRNIVISEPPPLDQLLQLASGEASLGWLRGLLNIWSRPRNQGERRFYLKFDSWQVRELPLILQAFPDVPWIFLYRDPVEVMVSHRRAMGSQMVPLAIDPRRLGVDPVSIDAANLSEYCARVLARFCATALEFAGRGRGSVVNYTELPEAVTGPIARHFGEHFLPEEIAAMAEAAKMNAKSPMIVFAADSAEKQREADAEIRELVRKWLDEPYRRLEALRLKQDQR